MRQESETPLSEGLKRRALEDLVLPLISIDEYESKISDKKAIVIGIYVTDEDPAIDLSNFIDRGHQPILDTEVSPAPTPEGQFVVFAELARNEEFTEILINMLNEISNVASVETWQFVCPGCKTPTEVTPENIEKHVVLDPTDIVDISDEDPDESAEEDDTDVLKEHAEFWKDACVDKVSVLDGQKVVLHHHGNEHAFTVEEPGPEDRHALSTESLDARLLESMLGINYEIWASQDGFLVSNGQRALLIRKIS